MRFFLNWCSYTLCIQTIMNTNKVHVSTRLLCHGVHHDLCSCECQDAPLTVAKTLFDAHNMHVIKFSITPQYSHIQ